jgi:hypothetical protein
MSDERVQTLLRDTLARQAGSAPPPPTDMYDRVRERNRRRRRRTVLATGLAAVLLVVGVSMAMAGVTGVDRAAPSADRPSGPNATRGSLAGDKALLDQATALLAGNGSEVIRSTVQVGYAEQYQGYRVVVLAAKDRDGRTIHGLVAAGGPGRPLQVVGGATGAPQRIDPKLGQQYLAPQYVLTRFMVDDRSFGVALFPPGFRATVGRGATIGADCRRSGSDPAALPLRDGAAFFSIANDDAPFVTVYPGPPGQQAFLSRSLDVTGSAPAGDPSTLPVPPPAGEIAAQIASTIRGRKDVSTELSQYAQTIVYTTGVGEMPESYLGVWAGTLPAGSGHGYAALWGGRYRSGALVLQGEETDQSGNGFGGWLTGCVPAGALDRTVFAQRLTDLPGTPLVIVAPAGATTAEVSVGSGAPVQVPLTGGGGFLMHAGKAGQVRALDGSGRVLATGVVGSPKVVGIPVQPR